MKRRVVILTEIISPYRIPLFNALAQRANIDLHVIFLSETDTSLRQWHVYKDEIRFSFEVLPAFRWRLGKYNVLLNRGVSGALQAAAPDVVVCGGYNYLASWQTLRWARAREIPFLVWSESNLQDMRRGRAPVEFLKRKFLKQCSGFAVPGKSAFQYLESFGIESSSIFTAPNAVDNELYAQATAAVHADREKVRCELGLPERYFLYVGRLVREKGVFDLLAAYARLDAGPRAKIGLVFVGDGAARTSLMQQAAAISPGEIKFPGFAQREQLTAYYALADVFILPTHTDPWGLVVNEAMASGLPIIVTTVAGCAVDLVREGWNGFQVLPGDTAALAYAMRKIAVDPVLRATMTTNSSQLIAQYSPEAWAEGLGSAVETMVSQRG
jgi:1,2-diacylglycerol 3-alpha-glucosyltransferase